LLVVLGVAFPLLGASLLAVWLLDMLWQHAQKLLRPLPAIK
jgi:uncharacterized iron-regulated membrane protein